MDYEELCEIAMNLIVNAGESKSLSLLAIKEARNGNIKIANDKIKEAENQLIKAHEIQTNLIVKETQSEDRIKINLLLVHAQDHLSMAIMSKEFAKEIIKLYEKLEG